MRFVIVTAALLALGACSLVPPLAAVEAASTAATEKPLSDHIVSIASGKHCSTLRTNADLTYCEEDEPVTKSRVYCYRTLGNITCYDRPNPYIRPQNQVGKDDELPPKAPR